MLHLRCIIAHKTLFSPLIRYLIFTMTILQSFAFGALWHTNRVSRLCIRHISTYSYRDEPKPFKVSSVLICVAYMGKLVSLGEMDWDNHTAMIMHII